MPVSSVQSGYQIIQQSQNMAEEAASDIAEMSKRDDLEFNKVDFEQTQQAEKEKEKPKATLEDALTKLNQANTYSQAGANVVRRSDEMIGTMLDTHV
ncbi:hypothetical protein [Vibrio sp. SCSIO 43137]|uniref:hypothetical protein n=1 Tax=Vibrio sp. SCSIO 43137 TaxID=3021011 RepID=UPI0023080392|nr:hypothetical protein [Vibrio sp. SCSIO 43137]WCE31447.1 hypothetical protein PK654_20145 [Vibrio sp. SCSIO 43137]